jgi:acyl-CoA thioesterase FadM
MARIKLNIPHALPFSTDFRVRIADINYGQHLGHPELLALVHEARVRFLAHYGFSEMDVEGVGIMMIDSAIVLKAETLHGVALQVDVGVTDLYRCGCDVVYRVTDKGTGKEVAHVKTGIVFFDYEQRKLMPVPEGFRKNFGEAG